MHIAAIRDCDGLRFLMCDSAFRSSASIPLSFQAVLGSVINEFVRLVENLTELLFVGLYWRPEFSVYFPCKSKVLDGD